MEGLETFAIRCTGLLKTHARLGSADFFIENRPVAPILVLIFRTPDDCEAAAAHGRHVLHLPGGAF